ncbi:hypothetical protein SESBI_15576 [Sesbania bispinosa]|nr:hypothetical protein SESBI_15576 [Sesbania bispinosa]
MWRLQPLPLHFSIPPPPDHRSVHRRGGFLLRSTRVCRLLSAFCSLFPICSSISICIVSFNVRLRPSRSTPLVSSTTLLLFDLHGCTDLLLLQPCPAVLFCSSSSACAAIADNA